MMLPPLLSSMYARDAASAQGFPYRRCGFVLRKGEVLLRLGFDQNRYIGRYLCYEGTAAFRLSQPKKRSSAHIGTAAYGVTCY